MTDSKLYRFHGEIRETFTVEVEADSLDEAQQVMEMSTHSHFENYKNSTWRMTKIEIIAPIKTILYPIENRQFRTNETIDNETHLSAPWCLQETPRISATPMLP